VYIVPVNHLQLLFYVIIYAPCIEKLFTNDSKTVNSLSPQWWIKCGGCVSSLVLGHYKLNSQG